MHQIIRPARIIFLTFFIGVWSAGLPTKAEMLLAKFFPNLVFSPSSRGCGCGHDQYYSMLDGRFVFEGDSASACPGFQDRLSEIDRATKIIKRVSQPDRFGEPGERIEFLYNSADPEEERAVILWHSEKKMTFIDAPTLEIALGFESVNADDIH